MKFFFVVLLVAFGLPCVAFACPSLDEAHQLFKDGHITDAVEGLNCLVKDQPQNFDALRFLIDIHWWQGDAQEAEALAETISKMNVKPDDPELLIHLARIADRFHLGANIAHFSGESTTSSQVGVEGNLLLDYRDAHKNDYGLGYSHQEHVFSGTSVIDNNVSGGYTWNVQPRTYVEARTGYSFTAQFSPRWFLGVEPHYVFKDESDVSVGYQYNRYTTQVTSLATVAGSRPMTDQLTPSIRVYGLMTSHLLLSSLGSLKWKMLPDYYSNVFVAGGRTLEAPGLENPFYSLGAAAGHYFTPALDVHLDFSYYYSTFRNEIRVGLGMDWYI